MQTSAPTMKSEELEEANSQLNGDTAEKEISKDELKDITNQQTPMKRKYQEEISECVEEKPAIKKQRSEDEIIEAAGVEIFNHKKRFSEEELQDRHRTKQKYLKYFINISIQYSQFLEKKIDGKGGEATDSPRKVRDVMEKMKFFEGGTLHPYQIEGVTWLIVLYENCVNGILADEMGLGKTIQVIALFCHLYERHVDGPYMIVAPLSTLGNWQSEFNRFAPQLPVVRLQGSLEERQQQMREISGSFYLDGRRVKPVVLCSYQTPLYEVKFLQRYSWTYIVVDEGHRIKNPDSKLSQELRSLQSENRLVLTGTPLQNSIKELWALFNFLMPDLFKDIENFSVLLDIEDIRDKDKILENEAQNKIISTIHKVLSPFMLRREKKFVLTDLIPKKEIIIYCPLTDLQKFIYRATLQRDMNKLCMKKSSDIVESPGQRSRRKCTMRRINYAQIDKSSFDVDDDDITVTIKETFKGATQIVYPDKEVVPVDCPNCPYYCRLTMQNIVMMLRKVVNHSYLIWYPLDVKAKRRELYVDEGIIKHSGKMIVLDSLLPKLRAQGHKVLLFSTLVMFMDLIEEFLILRGYNYRRLDGSTSFDQRNASITDFSTDPNVFIFMLSTRAGGLGLNLTAADTVIFMDRDWNPMADLQAQDRCHRIGQTKPVMIYSLIVKNTVDEIIVMRGDIKKRLEKIIIQEGKFKTLKKVPSDDELQELENLLSNEEESTKIRANKKIYTDEELDKILDRTALLEVMEMKNKM